MLGTMGELCQENPPIIKIALLFQTDTAIGDILYFVSFQEIYLATFPMVSLGLLDSPLTYYCPGKTCFIS